jgi:hypothetical protein
LQASVRDEVTQRLERQLEEEVTSWLQRGYHKRRGKVGDRRTQAVCKRCGTRVAKAFSRNGPRPRQLVTTYGVLNLWLPRVVCECGGERTEPLFDTQAAATTVGRCLGARGALRAARVKLAAEARGAWGAARHPSGVT